MHHVAYCMLYKQQSWELGQKDFFKFLEYIFTFDSPETSADNEPRLFYTLVHVIRHMINSESKSNLKDCPSFGFRTDEAS